MNNLITKNLIRFIGLAILQLVILKDVDISWPNFRFIHLIVFPLAIMLLPIRTPRVMVILLAFFLGLFVDIFYDSIGVHASAAVMMAFSRKIVLSFLEPYGGYSVDQIPTLKNMGFYWFFIYSGTLLGIYLLFYFSMEAFSLVFFFQIIMNTIFSLLFSLLLVFLLQLIFNSKT
jgi:hypothetical protein